MNDFVAKPEAEARLHHTNIVPVFEVGQDAETRFYAMQFIQGQSLEAVITELRHLRIQSQSRASGEAKGKSQRETLTLAPSSRSRSCRAASCPSTNAVRLRRSSRGGPRWKPRLLPLCWREPLPLTWK